MVRVLFRETVTQDRVNEPVEGWKTFFERHDHAQALATETVGARSNTHRWIYSMQELAVLYRECGAPEYDERSH